MASDKKLPVAPTTGSNKLKSSITLISNNATPRQPWRARVPSKFLPVSAELLASKLFKEAQQQ